MVAPVPLAAATAIYIDDDLVVAELQPADLYVIASIDGWAVGSDGALEQIVLQRLVHVEVEAFLAGGQRPNGLANSPET